MGTLTVKRFKIQPPKKSKTQKATDELKKKNSNKAKDIVDELKKISQQTDFVQEMAVTAKTSSTSKRASTITNSKLIATAAASKAAITNAASKPAVTTTTSEPAITTTTSMPALDPTITSSDDFAQILQSDTELESGTSDCNLKLINMVSWLKKIWPILVTRQSIQVSNKAKEPLPKSDSKRKSDNEANEKQTKLIRFTRKTEAAEETALTADIGNSKRADLILNPTVAGTNDNASIKGAAREYVYEIDCQRVGDHVNVTDLVSSNFFV